MMLPNLDKAVIPRAKIVQYLLSGSHPSGKWKAVFFRRVGFRVEEWELLAEALKAHASAHEVVRVEPSAYGMRYVIEGELITPSGRSPIVRTVWFIGSNSRIPRLATAYPL